jgi:hypothetical protein
MFFYPVLDGTDIPQRALVKGIGADTAPVRLNQKGYEHV